MFYSLEDNHTPTQQENLQMFQLLVLCSSSQPHHCLWKDLLDHWAANVLAFLIFDNWEELGLDQVVISGVIKFEQFLFSSICMLMTSLDNLNFCPTVKGFVSVSQVENCKTWLFARSSEKSQRVKILVGVGHGFSVVATQLCQCHLKVTIHRHTHSCK